MFPGRIGGSTRLWFPTAQSEWIFSHLPEGSWNFAQPGHSGSEFSHNFETTICSVFSDGLLL